MKKFVILYLFIVIAAVGASAQAPPAGVSKPVRPSPVATLPGLPCSRGRFVQATDTGTTSICAVDGLSWKTVGTGSGTVTSVTGTTPISSTGGATPAISIANAAADGATKGAASFTAADFDATAGNISLDYSNGQAASAVNKGFLIAADWSTFNNKQPALGFTAENSANKENVTIDTSTTKYPTVNLLKTGLDLKQNSLGFTAENAANKDATGGYAGLTLFKINFKNAANTFTSFFTNTNSAARTYTFQNRDGTIADDTDLATKQATITFGTGVQTALGVNVGSAGAPVLNGGALGSPSSVGTLPALILGGTIAGGGNQINNVIIGTSASLAGSFTALVSTTSTTGGAADAGEPLQARTSGGTNISDTASRVARLMTNNGKWTSIHFTDVVTSDADIGFLGSATAGTRKFCISADNAGGLNFCIDGSGHLFLANSKVYGVGTPGIAGNGTLNTGSKDSAGKVTATGTGASTIVLTFSSAFTNAPSCMVTNEATANLVRPISTPTTLTINATIVSGDSISYQCIGY